MSDLRQSVDQINREIVRLWKDRFRGEQGSVRWPMISPVPSQNGLTVIGCNPALPRSNYYSVPLFSDETSEEQHAEDLTAFEVEARKKYRYYRPFHLVAEQLNLAVEHVDLFFYRETSQAKLRQLVTNTDGKLNEFGHAQVELAVQLVTLSRPRIILVPNAFAADVFKEHFRLSTLDQEGLHWVTLDGQRTPVFLSGMLSGQRCMDRYSRERLVWHMRRTCCPDGA